MVSSSTATHHLPADLLALTSSCFDGGLEAAADRVVAHAIANRGGYGCLCNVHVLVTALHDASLRETIEGAELFLYPGDRHLFTDSSLPAYDERAAALVRQRVLQFLAPVG